MILQNLYGAQHARWLDSSIITGLPDFSREERVDRMLEWQRAIVGFKTDADGPQDSAGDTYYAWTHALAGVAYQTLPSKPSRRTALASRTFERGTELMHSIVHRRNPQAVVNDHSGAAEYGNAVGRFCSDLLTNEK